MQFLLIPVKSTNPVTQVKKVPIDNSIRLLTFELIFIFEQKFIKFHSIELYVIHFPAILFRQAISIDVFQKGIVVSAVKIYLKCLTLLLVYIDK